MDKEGSLAATVVHEGVLVKQGHFRKNWKVRYFVLGDDGLLSYWDYDTKQNKKVGLVLGSIFLQGSSVEEGSNDSIVIRTLTGKDYPLKKASDTSEQEFSKWKDLIQQYSQSQYKPPSVQLSTYLSPPIREAPQPPSAPGLEQMDSVDADDGYLKVTVSDAPKGEKDGKNAEPSYTIESQLGQASETVTRKWRDIQKLRRTLANHYYHLLVPPLSETAIQAFFDRLIRHKILRQDPELHLFLGHLNQAEIKERNKKIQKGSKVNLRDEADPMPEYSRKHKQEVEATLGSKHFDDPILERSQELRASAGKFQQMMSNTQTHLESMSKADDSYTKGMSSLDQACKLLGKADQNLESGFLNVGEVAHEILEFRSGLTASHHFYATLLAYVEFVDSMKGCIQNRMNRIFDYQNMVKTTNEEKMSFLSHVKEGAIGGPKKDSPLFGPDTPTRIKMQEEKMSLSETEAQFRKDEADKACLSFTQEMAHFHQWKVEDFKSALVGYVEEQQRYHQFAMEQWAKLGSSLQEMVADSPKNIDWVFNDPDLPQGSGIPPLRAGEDQNPAASSANVAAPVVAKASEPPASSPPNKPVPQPQKKEKNKEKEDIPPAPSKEPPPTPTPEPQPPQEEPPQKEEEKPTPTPVPVVVEDNNPFGSASSSSSSSSASSDNNPFGPSSDNNSNDNNPFGSSSSTPQQGGDRASAAAAPTPQPQQGGDRASATSAPTPQQQGGDRASATSAPTPQPQQGGDRASATSAPTPPPQEPSFQKFQAKVLYDFNAKWDMELSITQGSLVMVENEHDGGWYSGYILSKSDSAAKRGFFPKSYIQKL